MTDEKKYEALKLENQLCFPMYAAARQIVRQYTPYLKKLDLTYTQYLVLMVLWEKQTITVSELGACLYLDSGTLTPLLKKMEAHGLVRRARDQKDERVVHVTISQEGMNLREKCLEIPAHVGSCVKLKKDQAKVLYEGLYAFLSGLKGEDHE